MSPTDLKPYVPPTAADQALAYLGTGARTVFEITKHLRARGFTVTREETIGVLKLLEASGKVSRCAIRSSSDGVEVEVAAWRVGR